MTTRMLSALALALDNAHQVTPDGDPRITLPCLVDPAAWQVHLPERLASLDGQTELLCAQQALMDIQRWLVGPDPHLLSVPAQLVLSRADANFANCIWDGQRMALVDFEYGGWRDRAYDLADLIELDGACAAIFGRAHASVAAWDRFIAAFSLSTAERERFRAARRFLAWVWALRLWPREGRDEDDRFRRQLRRIETL